MKKIVANFYLLALLGLVAQAIYVVSVNNSAITDSLKVGAVQTENKQLQQKISLLEDKIARMQSLNYLLERVEASEAGVSGKQWQPIGERQVVSAPVVASLP
jgi:C4-dicarboxylate-specific signal transduction histidine kinase